MLFVADEFGHELRAGVLVDLARRADLLDHRIAHDDDLVGHRHRLLLRVGDHDEGDPRLALDLLELHHHLLAQVVVERPERLVEEEHGGLADEGAGEGDPLLLAAAQVARSARRELGKAHHLEHLPGPARPLLRVHPLHLEAELDVLEHRPVGEEREALEHHRGVAPGRGQIGDILTRDVDPPLGGVLQTPDHAKGGGLAAAARAQHRHELAVHEIGREVDDRAGALVEGLGDAAERHVRTAGAGDRQEAAVVPLGLGGALLRPARRGGRGGKAPEPPAAPTRPLNSRAGEGPGRRPPIDSRWIGRSPG